MSTNLNGDERELLKLIQFFRKHSEKLAAENKMDEEYRQFIETCDKFSEQLDFHARNREIVLAEREQLKNLVKDNAQCPKCHKNANLKAIGTDKSTEGWVSNKYKCRGCNIEFVWNAPNNPWDMIPYVEKFIADLEIKLERETGSPEEKQPAIDALEQMKANLGKLKPVVEGSDKDLKEMEERDREMREIVIKFKKHLMIEKIKME
jgi:hypothetical protein